MLILTRYVGERLSIGNNIWITVLSEQDGCVSLGINAPREIGIYREEIYLKRQKKTEPVDEP
mgnify:CR=1 FL=1